MGIGGQLVTIVVDVANVMGSRPDGWWRDRAAPALAAAAAEHEEREERGQFLMLSSDHRGRG